MAKFSKERGIRNMNDDFDYKKCDVVDMMIHKMQYPRDLREKERGILKDKLEKHFDFEIPNYIIDDILDNEKYHHICLVINLSVTNHELTEQNGETLKKGLKKIFCIENDYDRVEKLVLIKHKFTFEEWHKEYCNHEFVDINKYLTENDKDIMKKLKIKIKEGLYSEREFEVIDLKLNAYYRDEEDMTEEELEEVLPLPEGVAWEDYKNLTDKINQIGIDYNLTYYKK